MPVGRRAVQAVPTLTANQRLTTLASNRTELVGELGPCWVVVAVIGHIAALTVEPHGPVVEILGVAVKDRRGTVFGQLPAEVSPVVGASFQPWAIMSAATSRRYFTELTWGM